MKKIFVILTCLVFILFSFVFFANKKGLSTHFYYITNSKLASGVSRNLSFCYEVEEKTFINIKSKENTIRVIGETFIFKNVKNIDKLFETFGINIRTRSFLNDKEILSGISSKVIYGTKDDTNVQISIDKNVITIGFPIIYGAY